MQCNNNQVAMPKSSCSYLSNGTIYLNPCSNGYTCQTGFDTSYCIPDIPLPPILSYPGEPCKHSTDCKYGKCKYGYCQGKSTGDSCSLNAQCAPGRYCKTGTCIALISEGSSGCVLDFDCVNSAGCLDGVCVAYFSLSVGTSVSRCALQYSEFCTTATCWENVCINLISSYHSLPTLCDSYLNCTSKINDDGDIFYSDCVCGYNNKGTSYCSLFSGDDYYALYISSLSN